MGIRRATAKRPTLVKQMQTSMKSYNQAEAGATETGNDDLFGEPAPHPNQLRRKSILDEVKPKGPVGYLLQAVNCIGGILNRDFTLDTRHEAAIDILTMPYQALATNISRTASRARTTAASRLKTDRKCLTEIDTIATLSPGKNRTSEDQSLLKTTQVGGGWDKVSISEKREVLSM